MNSVPEVDFPSDVFAAAVQHFWATRTQQSGAQGRRGVSDQGQRGAVTGGKQMDGFLDTIAAAVGNAGSKGGQVHRRARVDVVLPGFYRPTKEWDLLVVRNGRLIAVIELKSQVGPSFGNNFNNRCEEAIGNAEDLWTAYREGGFGSSPAPWLGYLFLLEDCARSRQPVAAAEPHFPVRPEFKAASYALRYELLCRKLVLERKYTSACFLVSPRPTDSGTATYSEPAEDLTARRFLTSLLAHMLVE